MAIIIDEYEQRSPEWFAARLGNPGASSIDKIITTKGDISKQREDYLYTLAGELIAGKAEDTFQSQAMLAGSEREESSRKLFQMVQGVEVRKVAIVFKDEWKQYHCSPDGLVGDNGVLEQKNPMIKTHVRYLLAGKLPTDYFGQCQMSLYVTEREICYFMSAYEGLPPLIIEVWRDEAWIKLMADALNDFCVDLAHVTEKLRKLQ